MSEKKYLIDNELLMKEWDYELNTNLDPQKLTYGSNKKAWWICSQCGYKWQTSIYHRTMKGTGCKNCYCHKRNKSISKNLITTHPELVKDWHPIKNGNLTPNMFTKNSRYKAWWKCHICGKELFKEIKNYSGCISCKKMHFLEHNNLELTHPEILKEWDFSKNKITPRQVTYSAVTKVWWKCSKCGYEWQARINNRAIGNRGCPCCSNKIVVKGINDLATTHSNIAKEWHPSKNGTLSPNDVTYGYGKKVWWLCSQGHEYLATVNKRTSGDGTNCPICNSGRQTSFAEQAFYYYIKKLYPDTINRYTADFLERMELDIFIPSINLAIEYDGEAWHKEINIAREKKKYELCKTHNIKLIRLRERMTELEVKIADEQFSTHNLYKHNKLEQMIKEIIKRIDFVTGNWMLKCSIDVNIERDRFKIQEYCQVLKKDSLAEKCPEIAKEWHPTKNHLLTPYMVKAGSDKKVWWICPTCGNEYQTTIGHRTSRRNPTGCPKCAKEKVLNSTRRKINMIDITTGRIIKTFTSIAEAGRDMQINSSNISMVCKGQRNQAGGYFWSYADNK